MRKFENFDLIPMLIFQFFSTDLETGKVIPTYGRLKKIEWEGPMVETDTVKTLKDLAEYVGTSGEILNFQRVHGNLPEGMKGKCVFFDGKNRKESEPFLIIVRGEDGSDGANKAIVEEIPSSDPKEKRFLCNAFGEYLILNLFDSLLNLVDQ